MMYAERGRRTKPTYEDSMWDEIYTVQKLAQI